MGRAGGPYLKASFNLLLFNQLVKHSRIVSKAQGGIFTTYVKHLLGDDVVDPTGILVLVMSSCLCGSQATLELLVTLGNLLLYKVKVDNLFIYLSCPKFYFPVEQRETVPGNFPPISFCGALLDALLMCFRDASSSFSLKAKLDPNYSLLKAAQWGSFSHGAPVSHTS